MSRVGDGGMEGAGCDGREHVWSLPVEILDLRDGRADRYRVCARCGTEDIVPADS